MPLNSMKDLLVDQLNRLYAAEKHDAELLPKLARAALDPQLAAAFGTHAQATREHLSRLHSVFDDVGAVPRASGASESKGMKGLCRDCLTLANKRGVESHVRDAALIAAAQHVKHDEIAGYGCARTWASLLGHETASMQLRQSLIEERRADTELTRLGETLNKAALAAAPV